MSAKTSGLGPAWLDKATMAGAFDVVPTVFDRDYRRFAPASAVKEVSGKLYFHGRTVLDAWSRQQRGKLDASSDPLLDPAVDSPALEEYRKARARLAWMEVEQREKTHIAIAEIEPPLMRFAGLIRRAGEALARKYGNDAAEQVNQAIEQWRESVRGLLRSDERGADHVGPDGGSGEHAAAANGS